MPVWLGLWNHRDNSGLTPCRDAISVFLLGSIRLVLSINMSHFERKSFILRELVLWHGPCHLKLRQDLEVKHEGLKS